ncbi:MAG: HD domain-containing phosphohydrolase [Pirellula sp.]
MSTQKTWVIETSDLQVGSTLGFELTDSDGNVLHKAGMPITERLLERLKKKGIDSVSVQGQSESEAAQASEVLFAAFPEKLIRNLQATVDNAELAINHACQQLQAQEDINVEEILDSIDRFAAQSKQDSAAAFAVLVAKYNSMPQQLLDKLVSRSTTLAMMGITTSVVMGFSEDETVDTGLVGFLHDCSLMLHPEWFEDFEAIAENPKMLAEFRNHPNESADLLQGMDGITDDVLTAITQVHEQLDGSGFPNGQSGRLIHTSARILNLADAYLNLVQPMFKKDSVLCSDAMAYLCHHASQGRFDPQIARGFISWLSMYPIGSAVELDDHSTAIVIRGNPANPMKPTVQIIGAVQRIADLSVSPRSIVGPDAKLLATAKRISKSMLDNVLWRPDMVAELAT